MDQDNQQAIKQYLTSTYPYLQELEINQFIDSHSWIMQEQDKSIIDDFLKNYIKGIQERYTQLLANIELKIQLNLGQQNDQMLNEQKNQLKNEKNDQIINNQKQDENTFIQENKNQEQKIMEKIQIMKIYFQEEQNKQDFDKYLKFIYDNISQVIQNTQYRELKIQLTQYKILDFLIGIFSELGFIVIEQNSTYCELGFFDDNIERLVQFIQMIVKNYPYIVNNCVNQQLSPQQSAVQERLYYQFQAQQRRQQEVNQSMQMQQEQSSSFYDQQKQYRERMKQDYQNNQKYTGNNIMTMDKLYKNNEDIFQQPLSNDYNSKLITMNDIESQIIKEKLMQFGKLALEHTNKFRQQNKLSKLEWSQELCNIGMPHSINMGDKKVPFGHQGFNNRASAIQFQHGIVCENVAYCSEGYSDIPKTIVEGWIQSPGHRKNLLSDTNVCGIAVYKTTNNLWYFTQLLAKKY